MTKCGPSREGALILVLSASLTGKYTNRNVLRDVALLRACWND